VGNKAIAALTTVHTVPITHKLASPPLQRDKAHAQKLGQLNSAGSIGDAFIDNLQGLPAIFRGRRNQQAQLSARPPPTSPQKAWIFLPQ
jgi:hypothetical protein